MIDYSVGLIGPVGFQWRILGIPAWVVAIDMEWIRPTTASAIPPAPNTRIAAAITTTSVKVNAELALAGWFIQMIVASQSNRVSATQNWPSYRTSYLPTTSTVSETSSSTCRARRRPEIEPTALRSRNPINWITGSQEKCLIGFMDRKWQVV